AVPEGDRALEPLDDRVARLPERAREEEQRVHAPHLRVDRDRIGTLDGRVEERTTAAQRAGEPRRPRPGVADERESDRVIRALKEREDARRHPARLDGLSNRLRDE